MGHKWTEEKIINELAAVWQDANRSGLEGMVIEGDRSRLLNAAIDTLGVSKSIALFDYARKRAGNGWPPCDDTTARQLAARVADALTVTSPLGT